MVDDNRYMFVNIYERIFLLGRNQIITVSETIVPLMRRMDITGFDGI